MSVRERVRDERERRKERGTKIRIKSSIFLAKTTTCNYYTTTIVVATNKVQFSD